MFAPGGPSFWELARQAMSSTARGYDLLAPKFDVTPFRTPDAILEGTARHLESLPAVERALDLCCGTGAMMPILTTRARRVVGLDFSQGMLDVAAARLGGAVTLVRAEALVPPFTAAFDLITCFSALGHFLPEEQRPLVAAVSACLRPGGRFVFLTGRMPAMASTGYWLARAFNAAMHLRNWLWSPAFVMYYLTFLLPAAQSLLEEAGFEVEVVEGLFESPFERYVLVDAVKVARATAGTSGREAPRRLRRSAP
jgi:SAM-dependent methyltransferase